ncbi:MAG: thermonuclease family protein [Thermoanaerobaculales bacterium]|jgi:micrococcal nuclease|nr:thermonuclease family protein [Thermoanaerobaculales bacterium]
MKYAKFVMCSLVAVLMAAGPAVAGDATITGKCVKVVDGDTLIIDCGKATRTVEIHGVDAPELEQPWGKQTKSFMKKMVGGEKVEIEVVEGDGDSVVARVSVNGVDMSEMLVSRGLAWVPENANDSDLEELGAKAKAAPCGLWTDPDPQAPWDFREARS